MLFDLKDNVTGLDVEYKTTVDIFEKNGFLIFNIIAKNSQFYAPHRRYNAIHSKGDALEILIGTDPNRKEYYEIEVNPFNSIMLAKMKFLGVNKRNKPILDINFIPKNQCFVYSNVLRTPDGYSAEIRIEKEKLDLQLGDIYFNVYRLETDGGETEKHLLALNPTLYPKFHVPNKFVFFKDYI